MLHTGEVFPPPIHAFMSEWDGILCLRLQMFITAKQHFMPIKRRLSAFIRYGVDYFAQTN